MNKIEVVNNKITGDIKDYDNILLKDDDYFIVYKNSNIEITFIIDGIVNIFEYYNNSNCCNNYNLNNNSNLTLNRFSNDCSIKTTINLDSCSNLLYKYSSINFNDNNYNINVNHNESDTCSKIINYGINFTDKKLDFLINSHILKESINSNTYQDNKIILMSNNNSSIKPNLIVDNNEIEASHSAYLGHFKENELFYLKSRGINNINCVKLLSRAFLTSNMVIDETFKEIIINDLDKAWRC